MASLGCAGKERGERKDYPPLPSLFSRQSFINPHSMFRRRMSIPAPTPAFPTVGQVNAVAPKSFFDAPGLNTISSNVNYAIYPLTEKKGKLRSGYLVVQATLFELHKSYKEYKSKRQAKYFVNFADVFNVSMQSEPVHIKGECIVVMDPAETFFLRPTEMEYPLEAWFEWMLERARECRSNRLVRPVFREELFEAAWDVVVGPRPKLKRDYAGSKEERAEDLALKQPSLEGRKRLCICPTSFLLFKMAARPTYSVDVPFEKEDFADLPLNVVSNYGCQEKYFFVRIGRCSEIGSGELWMACESGAAAKAMHEHVSAITLRESERRRTLGIKASSGVTISSRVLKSRAHRERSQTANTQKSIGVSGGGGGEATSMERKDSSSALATAQQEKPPVRIQGGSPNGSLCSSAALASSISKEPPLLPGAADQSTTPSITTPATSTSSTAKKSMGLLPFRLVRPSVGSITSTCSASQGGGGGGGKGTTAIGSTPTTALAPGGAVYDCGQDYVSYDVEDTCQLGGAAFPSLGGRMVALAQQESRKSSAATMAGIATPGRQASICSEKLALPMHRPSNQMAGTSAPDDYMKMDESPVAFPPGRPDLSTIVFPLQEVRSYFSGSIESCCDSPRAYSLGSRPISGSTQQDVPAVATTTEGSRLLILSSPRRLNRRKTAKGGGGSASSTTTNNPNNKGSGSSIAQQPSTSTVNSEVPDPLPSSMAAVEDYRKRAHSLGTKSWATPALRRLSAAAAARSGGVQRMPLMGPSSISAISTTTPPISSSNDAGDSGAVMELRPRTDSMGSNESSRCNSRRNTNRSMASSSGHPDSHLDNDHVEIDFDHDGASCTSIDSPMNRSRNSSLGIQMPTSVRSALDLALANASRSTSRTSAHAHPHPHSHTHTHHHSHQHQQPSFKYSAFEEEQQGTVRKKSVPDMHGGGDPSSSSLEGEQRRRSTYDTAGGSLLVGQHRLHQKEMQEGGGGGGKDGHSVGGGGQGKGEEEDEYVMMCPPEFQQQLQMGTPRLISTIMESASSSSSSSSPSASPAAPSSPHCQEGVSAKGADDDYGMICLGVGSSPGGGGGGDSPAHSSKKRGKQLIKQQPQQQAAPPPQQQCDYALFEGGQK